MESISPILDDHYDDPYHRGGCDNPNFAGEAQSESSACQLRMELAVGAEDEIREAWFDGEGCQWCESLASLLVEAIEGGSVSKAQGFTTDQLLALTGVRPGVESPVCLNLAIQTLHRALGSHVENLPDDLADGTHFGGPSLREEC